MAFMKVFQRNNFLNNYWKFVADDEDDVKKIRGFDISIVTSVDNDEQARKLLREVGLPLVKIKGEE